MSIIAHHPCISKGIECLYGYSRHTEDYKYQGDSKVSHIIDIITLLVLCLSTQTESCSNSFLKSKIRL